LSARSCRCVHRGGCFQCHGGWNFSAVTFEGAPPEDAASRDGLFFNTGVSAYAAPNRGLAEHTGRAEDVGKFKAPTLRNIAVTGPYMHDGSMATLDDVIGHYAAGGRNNHANKTARSDASPCPLERPVAECPLVFVQHHFSGLDDDADFVALLQTELFGAAARDDAFELALANLDDNMGHDVAERHFDDFALELITR
jgi:cytochrome c peroxidase